VPLYFSNYAQNATSPKSTQVKKNYDLSPKNKSKLCINLNFHEVSYVHTEALKPFSTSRVDT